MKVKDHEWSHVTWWDLSLVLLVISSIWLHPGRSKRLVDVPCWATELKLDATQARFQAANIQHEDTYFPAADLFFY